MTEFLLRRFVKDADNVRDPQVRRRYGMLASITGILLNLLLFLSKFLVGTLSGSVSIVADAVNNLSDAGAQIVADMRRRRRTDVRHDEDLLEFFKQFFIGETVFDPQKLRELMPEAPADKFLISHGFTGAELFEGFQKTGIIDGNFTFYDGIVVVKDQTGVFQHGLTPCLL